MTEYGLDSSLFRSKFATEAPEVDEISKWLAPEIITHTKPVSKPTDVFAFAMLVMEVFTGEVPWGEATTIKAVSMIERGDRPDHQLAKVEGKAVRDLVENCWSQNPNNRPTIRNVAARLKGFIESGDFR